MSKSGINKRKNLRVQEIGEDPELFNDSLE